MRSESNPPVRFAGGIEADELRRWPMPPIHNSLVWVVVGGVPDTGKISANLGIAPYKLIASVTFRPAGSASLRSLAVEPSATVVPSATMALMLRGSTRVIS